MDSKPTDKQINLDFQEREIYTVEQLNHEVKLLLQQNFPLLWVEGELSNVARPASGHMYFSLKDEQAQVRCAMFRNANRSLPFTPEDGMHVLVRARISLYEPRGEYQLTIEHMEEAGTGLLQRKFEELKRKLNQEGLFNPELKKSLPRFPKSIAIITSATGAAVRDILSVLQRRYPLLTIRIYAVPVQGDDSAPAIANALDNINKSNASDVILLTRGGGSIEDLWSFNEENVARAIFHSKLPVVTGIGHEVDFTIADFVADLRAPTPSAAAEIITPDQFELLEDLQQIENSITYFIQDSIATRHQSIDWLVQKIEFLHPIQAIERKINQLKELTRRIQYAVLIKFSNYQTHLKNSLLLLNKYSPHSKIQKSNFKLQETYNQLLRTTQQQIKQQQHTLITLARTLDAVSPLSTLNRGYSIVSQPQTGQIISNSRQVAVQEEVAIRLAQGHMRAKITEKS